MDVANHTQQATMSYMALPQGPYMQLLLQPTHIPMVPSQLVAPSAVPQSAPQVGSNAINVDAADANDVEATTEDVTALPSKRSQKKDNFWAKVQVSAVLKEDILQKVHEHCILNHKAPTPDEADSIVEETHKQVSAKLIAEREALNLQMPSMADKAARDNAKSRIDFIQKHLDNIAHVVKKKSEGGTWNGLLWTWVNGISVHGVNKKDAPKKVSAASITDQAQADAIKRYVATIKKFGDTGSGLSGIEALKEGQSQQQVLREAAYAKRKRSEERREQQQEKAAKLAEVAVQALEMHKTTEEKALELMAAQQALDERRLAAEERRLSIQEKALDALLMIAARHSAV